MDVQRTGRIFGWLFIGTFITSIPARLLFIHGVGASWSDMHFVPGDTSHAALKWGAVLEFGLIVTQIGTAVVIYPLVRRQSETVSLGYVTARIMESVFAAIGIISIISVLNVADSLPARVASEPRPSPFKVTPSPTATTGPSSGVPDSSPASGTASCSDT